MHNLNVRSGRQLLSSHLRFVINVLMCFLIFLKVVPKKGVFEEQHVKKSKVHKDMKKEKENVYDRYLEQLPMPEYYNEHERYRGAVDKWQKVFDEKMTGVGCIA